MKAIQITMDEDLLGELDQHPAVKEVGRSAVLRQAACRVFGAFGAHGDSKKIRGWLFGRRFIR